jgi:hypothetical protein
MHELARNTKLQTLNNFNTAIVDGKFPASGSFLSAEPFTWWTFLVRAGTLDSELTVQLQQDTGATQTASIKAVTGAVVTVEATDDNQLFYIEVQIMAGLDIANSFTHMTLDISGAAGGNDYLDIVALGCNAKIMPVTQPATTSGVVVAG